MRGETYLAVGDAEQSAGEFQGFINHRGMVPNFSWGALARLGLARAYALQGTAQVRAAYQDFLTLGEGRRPRHPDTEAGQSGVHQARVSEGL